MFTRGNETKRMTGGQVKGLFVFYERVYSLLCNPWGFMEDLNKGTAWSDRYWLEIILGTAGGMDVKQERIWGVSLGVICISLRGPDQLEPETRQSHVPTIQRRRSSWVSFLGFCLGLMMTLSEMSKWKFNRNMLLVSRNLPYQEAI